VSHMVCGLGSVADLTVCIGSSVPPISFSDSIHLLIS
jgi:hypothetical protein